ncbi:MarR family winged helix-turn-helix transcriptional regulator [Clostridium sp. 'White wine YQ']|uniref:MarR family winged helix-turn-helix transcriptional regulator n=1 Tax=Clostridium sp. 'White wine YQ' TaxID=3027474 RepID=UPI002365B32E|nr:MarR family transcriptional regulator [Clostridium sp. 'White wine YQ']MDD7796168.1 MarR family transcriptional regulator [Clostridium sp. 'White wine YQ']
MESSESLGKWISILNRYNQNYISKNLKEYNIGSGQYIFILNLYCNDGISQDKLSDLLAIDKGTTAKAIKKLEEAGYVRREVDETDRRAYKLYVTQKALDIKPIITRVLNESSSFLSFDFTEGEKLLALKLLKKMSDNAIRYLE